MILDHLDQSEMYYGLGRNFAEAFDWLRSGAHEKLAAGRHTVRGDHLIAIVDEYTPKPLTDQSIWEAHRRYCDIQYMARGTERHGFAVLGQVAETTPYDSGRDVAFYSAGTDFVTLFPGIFTIYTPRDVHAPGLAAPEVQAVRKIVMKVLV